MKSKSKTRKTVACPFSHKQLPVCLICLKRIVTTANSDSIKSECNPFSQNIASRDEDNDLYKVFLYFCKRYLKLKNADLFLKAYSKSKDGEGGCSQFCESCHQLLGYLLNVYVELNGLKMQLLSKVKELGEVISQSKKSISNKLAVGLLKQICVQLNMSNYLVVDQLRRKLIEKCSFNADKMLPTIVLKRHVPDQTVTIALVSLIVLFSLIFGWDLQEILATYLPVSQLPDRLEIKVQKKSLSTKAIAKNEEGEASLLNDIPEDLQAPCIPDPDNMPLKMRTGTRGTTRRLSRRFQNFLPSEHVKTEGLNATNDEFVVAEEVEELAVLLAEDDLENQEDSHFGDDPEWMPEGSDEDLQSEPDVGDDSQFPKEEKFKSDDKLINSNPTPEPEAVKITTKRKRRRRNKQSPPRKRGRKPKVPQSESEPIYDPIHRCQQCNLDFKTRFLLCDHIAMIHEPNIENPFECQTCHKLHDGFKELRDHLIDHEDPEDKPFFCWFCDKSFSTQQHCDIHRRFFHFTLHQRLFCDNDECQEEFTCAKDQNEHLKSHLNLEQSPEEHIFICTKCGRGFLNRYRLQLHELTHWSKGHDGFFKCDLCWAYYRNTSVLMSHYNRVHLGENKITLHRCQKTICLLYEITQNEVDTHVGRHELTKAVIAARQALPQKRKHKKKTSDNNVGDNDDTTQQPRRRRKKKTFPVICEECGCEFSARGKLERHKFVHGEPQFPCTICKKKFRRKDHLDIHINRIHSKANLFICDVCGKACPTASELRYHVVEHEKKHKCQFCPMRFSRRTILTGHERTHTGEKLQCEWCPVSKSCLYDIKKHVRKCHPEEYKIHYADGARTQYRYKVMKDNAANAARERQERLTQLEKANATAVQPQPDESQQPASNADNYFDNSNDGNDVRVDEDILNLDNF